MSKQIKIADKIIGGGAPIAIQSMCNTRTKDAESTIVQILELEKAGCDIIRVAVPDMDSARAIYDIKSKIHIPLVADIHFDYRLAVAAMESGVDKVRINPGNIGSEEGISAVVTEAKRRGVPIRIGVNSGSVEKSLLKKYGSPCPEEMVVSAKTHIEILNKYD